MTSQPIEPNQCPSCEGEVHIEGNLLFGEMPCPHCQTKLWFLAAANDAKFVDYETSAEIRETAYSFIAERLDVDRQRIESNPKILDELEVDSLEAIEMMMDLEDELGFAGRDDGGTESKTLFS